MKILNLTTAAKVQHLRRFEKDYGPEEAGNSSKKSSHDDYKAYFEGNTSDDFKIGISLTPASIKVGTKNFV